VTIYFAPQAEADFATIIGYLAERNPVAAQELGERIFALIDKLTSGEIDVIGTTPSETLRAAAIPDRRTPLGRPGPRRLLFVAYLLRSGSAPKLVH
jgi:plasmid stabilization system protein ParE